MYKLKVSTLTTANCRFLSIPLPSLSISVGSAVYSVPSVSSVLRLQSGGSHKSLTMYFHSMLPRVSLMQKNVEFVVNKCTVDVWECVIIHYSARFYFIFISIYLILFIFYYFISNHLILFILLFYFLLFILFIFYFLLFNPFLFYIISFI